MSELTRLRWQCRRGNKELDLLLQRYLERDYSMADEAEKALFLELLKLEDDELLRVLMKKFGAAPDGVKLLVDKIKSFSSS
jgi:antitoxin CptB